MSSAQKVLRFILVGIVNTGIDFGLLFLLTGAQIPVVTANTISTGCALAFSFVANQKYTFRAHQNGSRRKTIALFLAVTLFGLWVLQPLVMLLCLPAFSGLLSPQASLFASKIAATGVSMTWNYLLYNRFVFPSSDGPDA